MTDKVIEVLTMESIALLLFLFAYLIGVKGKLNLIAGYNEKTADRVKDKEGLARLVVRVCILIGLYSAFMPIATLIWGAKSGGMAMCIGSYGGFILGVVAMVILQSREYTA